MTVQTEREKRAEYARTYYLKNKEKILERSRAYYLKNKEMKKEKILCQHNGQKTKIMN